MQRRSTNTKQTPDGKSQHKPANVHLTGRESGTNWHKLASPAQTLQHWRVFLETKTTIFFPGLLHPTYVNEKKKIWRKSIYLYFCTEETHGTKTLLVLCLHANKMSGIVWPSFPAPCRLHPPEMMTERRTGLFFFNIKRCFVLFTPHSTRLGSTESIWKNLYNRHQI